MDPDLPAPLRVTVQLQSHTPADVAAGPEASSVHGYPWKDVRSGLRDISCSKRRDASRAPAVLLDDVLHSDTSRSSDYKFRTVADKVGPSSKRIPQASIHMASI